MNEFSDVLGTDYELVLKAIPHRQELQEQAAQIALKQAPPLRILELGCGSGLLTQHLLQEDEVVVEAVDNEPVMLDQLRTRLGPFIRADKLRIVCDDVLSTLKKAASGVYDVVISGYTIHNFLSDYRHDVHFEIARVLKKDGLFVNADKYAHDDNTTHQEALNWQLEQFQEVFSSHDRDDLVQAWTSHYLLDESPGRIMFVDDASTELYEAGFCDVDIQSREKLEAILVAKK